MAGTTQSNDGDVGSHQPGFQRDFWVFKLDSNGNLIWENTYGGGGIDQAYAIQQTIDGGYIVVGDTSSSNGDVSSHHGGLTDAWVIKLNANGALIWEQTYGGSGDDTASNIQQTSDGGYIVSGTTASVDGDISQNHGGQDIWVFKLFSNGVIDWSETYGGSSIDRISFGVNLQFNNDALQQTNDGGYMVSGYTNSNDGDISSNHGAFDAWIFKLDANGNLAWEKTYGGSNYEDGGSIQQTLDGNYIIATQTRSYDGDVGQLHGTIRMDFWVFKIDPTGVLLWEQTYGGTNEDGANAIQQVSNCEYILTGYARSSNWDVGGNQGQSDFWVVKLQMEWPPPLVTTPQDFCWSDNATLADLGVTGNSVPAGFTPIFTWYDDDQKTTILPEATPVVDGENYFVSQTIDGCESPLAEVVVNVIPDIPPTATSPQSFCLDDAPEIPDIAVVGQNLSWYQDPGGTVQLPTSTTLEDGKTYYVSQTTGNCESSLLPITVEVFPPPAVFPVPDVVACDTDGNGKGEFHLPDLDNAVSGGAANTTVTYHATLSDAENGTAVLPDDYTVTNSPESIYARVLDTGTGCDGVVEIQLLFSAVPEIMALKDLSGCDDGNNKAVFDLTQNHGDILGNQDPQHLKITYHETQPDAENGDNALPSPESHASGPKIIFVRLENEQTGCYDTGSFELHILPRPDIANISLQEEFCSDLPGGDFATIDLTAYDSQINPGGPANTEVVYYAGINAYTAGESIENPESYTTTSNPQTLVAETLDTGTGCRSLTFVEVEIYVNDRPDVDLSQYDGLAICWDSDATTPVEGGDYGPMILETGLDENAYVFEWALNGETLPATGPSLEAGEPGEYEVMVSDTDGISTTCTGTSSATITEANPPEFVLSRTSGFVSDENGILVSNVSGLGNFVFRVDDGDWLSLTDNHTLLFENLAPGTHTVYGRSLEGCGMTLKAITLIGYPKFFTPNSDGQNDRWNIIGLEKGKVYIFDRYGKLLTSLKPSSPGWDGNYNGKAMPSDDYWFKVEFLETLPDGTEKAGEFAANFSLIR